MEEKKKTFQSLGVFPWWCVLGFAVWALGFLVPVVQLGLSVAKQRSLAWSQVSALQTPFTWDILACAGRLTR